jgi:hypothetical protein
MGHPQNKDIPCIGSIPDDNRELIQILRRSSLKRLDSSRRYAAKIEALVERLCSERNASPDAETLARALALSGSAESYDLAQRVEMLKQAPPRDVEIAWRIAERARELATARKGGSR